MDGKLRNLRPYCLGFGLFWSIPLLALIGAAGIKAPSSDWLAFVWTNQLAVAVCMPPFAVLLARHAGRVGTRTAFLSGGLLALAGFLYAWCFPLGNSTPALSVATGAVLGGACALAYPLWQVVYSNEGQSRSAIYLSLASVLAVALCLLAHLCPPVAVSCLLAVVLPFGHAHTLWRSMQDTVALPARDLAPYRRAVLADVWKPVLCASAVCLAWSLASHMPALYDEGLVVAIFVGLGVSCLLVAALSLRPVVAGFGAHGAYQTLFPLIGIVLFAPTLFGSQWLPFTVGTLTFGARLMMLLSSMLAAAYAARTQFSPAKIYLACVYPLHLASFVGDTVGFLLVGADLADYGSALRIPALCLVVLFGGLVVSSFGKGARSLAEPVDDTLLINPGDGDGGARGVPAPDPAPAPADPVAPAAASVLSSRESEVVELLLRGNTIAAIADRLFISENTVRGHMKRIYRKLDVHSRQELIDLLERGPMPPAAPQG